MPSLDNYFGFNNAATSVKSRRLEIISGNITNASTPGYKARDLDFAKILKQYSLNGAGGGAQATQPKHIGAGVASWENVDSAITSTIRLIQASMTTLLKWALNKHDLDELWPTIKPLFNF